MEKPITMQTIADELGLSRTVVSFIVNNHARQRSISKATIKRVQDHMRSRGYVPSRQALSLRKGVTAKVGIFYCGQLYTHLLEAFNDITSLYNKKPDQLEIVVVPSDHIITGIQELLGRGVTKLLWIHTLSAAAELEHPDIYNYLDRFDKVIIYNYRFGKGDNSRDLEKRGYRLVGVDRMQGYRLVAEKLKSLGHTRVAIVSPDFFNERMELFNDAGFTCEPISDHPGGQDRKKEAGAMVARALQQALKKGVTAAVFHDDELAVHTMNELRNGGTSVPEQISITGYEGMPVAELVSPSLTTLVLPVSKMIACAEKLLENGEKRRRFCFDLDLVGRQSHGPVKTNIQ